MARYLLSIGSNCPQAAAMMARAGRWLAANFGDPVSSGVYSTPALNGVSPDYLNMVARVSSDLTPDRLTAFAKAFEAECGRTPQSKARGCVEMDVDLVQVDNVILRPAEFSRPYFITGFKMIENGK